MSLSSLLLSAGGKKAIDSELDALFTAKPVAPFKKIATAISIPGSSKDVTKKRKTIQDDGLTEEPTKRSKSGTGKSVKKRGVGHDTMPGEIKPQTLKKDSKASEKSVGKGKAKQVEEAELEEENSDIENAYLGSHTSLDDKHPDSAEDVEAAPVHESLNKSNKRASRSGPKSKFVPADETPERRDQRTIFVGNLPVDVAQKRPLLKQLQRHLLSQVPSAKIESTRFRSIPFQTPTSKLEDDGDDEGISKAKANPKAPIPTKQARPHDLDRISTWRSRQDDDEAAASGKSDEKQYLNPSQKKKIAFINQEFHSTANTVNAYVVFAHPLPLENWPANLPPPSSVLDPYKAARTAAVKCDGTLFMERVLRVDLVGKKHLGTDTTRGEDLDVGLVDADPKSSVFVGNLDFASKEEDLRVFFEGVVSAERGPPPQNEDDEDDDNVRKPMAWVVRVRVVRDKETQLGKGFAYVQFADRECVDEILALEDIKLKFAKRKLRVQRCKTLPGSSASTRLATSDNGKKSAQVAPGKSAPPVRIIVPKGDPALGEKLAHMPKEARKQYKSANADRVARRLAKKKARVAMGNSSGVKVQGKERERVRRTGATGSGAGGSKKKASSGRVRSEKSMAKRNGKKSG